MSAHESVLLGLAFLPLSLWFLFATAGGTGAPGLVMGMMLGAVVFSVPFGWIANYLLSGLLCFVLLPAIYLAQRLIGEPIRRDTTGWIAGSAVAIVGSAGGLFQLNASQPVSAVYPFGVAWILAIQIGCGLVGIAAAQAGGYLGSLSALRKRRQTARHLPIRFSVWRMMAVTAILAVLLSIVRLAGEFAVPLIISTLVSSVLAWAIHRPVAWATNRWLDWRLKRRRAKRLRGRALA